ncbi:chemotaxis protein [Neobacillus niacini]|uniref:chemotaxis protein n=1 Tax=Neobacillus niacini TaxID=86668 RepID=UPI002866BD4B|nr:chemotaxis protein [Neobacillus niacini]MDR7000085.1 two-component system chemotaxis response regulator CheV [Neobacillus niacini]
MVETGILLESGTNELEVVEFTVANSKFGINVIKVREIINPVPVIEVPHSHESIEGIMEVRGEVLPVINMAKVLGYPESEYPTRDKYIITEFNQQKQIFHVHKVDKIHRISWSDIDKPTNLYQSSDNLITGIVRKENELVLLLDFEKIVIDINPFTGINIEKIKKVKERNRSNYKIVVAEDSTLLRNLISTTLAEAGLQKMDFFENGKDALNYLETSITNKTDIDQLVDLIITDIEMPVMDGLFFTKQVKENPLLAHIPVVLFSSLITDDLRHKGENVGADAQVSKPEIGELINVIDQLIEG